MTIFPSSFPRDSGSVRGHARDIIKSVDDGAVRSGGFFSDVPLYARHYTGVAVPCKRARASIITTSSRAYSYNKRVRARERAAAAASARSSASPIELVRGKHGRTIFSDDKRTRTLKTRLECLEFPFCKLRTARPPPAQKSVPFPSSSSSSPSGGRNVMYGVPLYRRRIYM